MPPLEDQGSADREASTPAWSLRWVYSHHACYLSLLTISSVLVSTRGTQLSIN